MAAEVPGLGARVATLTERFAQACRSTDPALADYEYTSVPQLAKGGTHGFFAYNSEIPRLAAGVPDPKEFIRLRTSNEFVTWLYVVEDRRAEILARRRRPGASSRVALPKSKALGSWP